MRVVSIALMMATMVAAVDAKEVDYEREIRPLLAEKCTACHGSIKQEAGLRLDAGKLILRGSENGPVINLQSPDQSLLLSRTNTKEDDLRMPPKAEGTQLTPSQIDLLKRWIASGASYPEDEKIPAGPESHWAYRIPDKTKVPRISNREWSTNPIDSFIMAKLQDAGIKPAPPADKRTLLRRVYLDLIGLPPTPDQQEAFLTSNSEAAYIRLVDQLLENTAYGERWARHWMDVWRYSDWDGYKQQLRGSQRHIWRWRDWIIESLNEDKPYDQMVVEMLAGDEIAPTDRKITRATGFLARNYHNSNRDIWLDATVEHTSKAFLGLTMNCARCHDHKYDPVAQNEYYAMRAIFEPHNVRTERIPGEPNTTKDGFVRVFDAKPDASTYLYIGGNEKLVDKEHQVTPSTPAIINLDYKPNPVHLPPIAVFPALQNFYETESLDVARRNLRSAEQAVKTLVENDDAHDAAPLNLDLAHQKLELAKAELNSTIARWNADKAKYGGNSDPSGIQRLAELAANVERIVNVKRARVFLTERQHTLSTIKTNKEKDEKKKQADIKNATKEVADAERKLKSAIVAMYANNSSTKARYTSVGKSFPSQSTGRRLALARWIIDQKNPLTARVAVNHIWLRHFGEPLVANVFDFGMRTPAPVHHALLDWLAVEFMQNDWSMKHIHRLIVTSRVYRGASQVDSQPYATNRQVDPDNHYLWKATVRRLDAEVIRDSILHLAGSLDRRVGGPDLDSFKGDTIPRRSLYFRHAYEKQMRLLVTFDAATPGECYRRSESVVPQQALALLNGPLAFEQSRVFAERLNKAHPISSEFIQAAYAAVLCRECSNQEMVTCSEFLVSQSAMLSRSKELNGFDTTVKVQTAPSSDPQLRARQNLIHVLINHNDFVTLR